MLSSIIANDVVNVNDNDECTVQPEAMNSLGDFVSCQITSTETPVSSDHGSSYSGEVLLLVLGEDHYWKVK